MLTSGILDRFENKSGLTVVEETEAVIIEFIAVGDVQIFIFN